MAILMYMSQTYSIAQARDQLPRLVRAAERGAEVELTRRGEKVAVLLSVATRAHLAEGGANYWDRLVAFRRKHPALPRGTLKGLRQRDQGRDVKL
jgi:prevent-host-death family protein